MVKKTIEPKKQSRLKYQDMSNELDSMVRQSKLKNQVRMKKQGRLTDIDFLTMSVLSGRVI